MKPRSIKPWYFLVAILVTGSALTLISWDRKQDSSQFRQFRVDTDTTPDKNTRDKKVRDLDEALQELDKIDLKIDMESAMREVTESLKKIDSEKIRMDVEKAMKEIDVEKIMAEVNKAMKEVDMENIKKEVERAMKEIDVEKMNREIKASLAKVDLNEMKLQLDQLKNIELRHLDEEMKKVQEELKTLRPKIEKEMQKARGEIEKAKVKLKEYKEFVDGLDKDGLLNKNEPYTIRHKDGELTINGKKASAETYNKYRSFLEKNDSFNINKEEDDFDIDMD